MADKPTVKYEVRAQRDPVNNVTIYVPAIVDRNAAKSLATVIENAIDRGLIVGVKPSAANGIATGLCEQLFKEFKDGNAVNFDGYFYGRLYLDGTVNPDGNLVRQQGEHLQSTRWRLVGEARPAHRDHRRLRRQTLAHLREPHAVSHPPRPAPAQGAANLHPA